MRLSPCIVFALSFIISSSAQAWATADASFYDVLSVTRTASLSEIRSAYRKKALTLHPDKARWADTTAEFIRVSEAYATLSDPRKRRAYDDATQSTSQSSFSFSVADAFQVLEEFLESSPLLEPLLQPVRRTRLAFSHWKSFSLPLPQLIATGALVSATALELVDWEEMAQAANNFMQDQFVDEVGDVRWGKVAATGAAVATGIAAAMDSYDDGNRTQALLGLADKLLNLFTGGESRRKTRASPPSTPSFETYAERGGRDEL